MLLRRGYCHFGQPLDSTIAAMKPLPRNVQRPLHAFRRNMCQCNVCRPRQPHSVLHATCEHVRTDQASDISAAQFSQMSALPPAHPLAVASRIGNPAIEDGRKKKKGGQHAEGAGKPEDPGREASQERDGGRGGPSPAATRGGRAKQSEPSAKPKRHLGSTPAGKDGVVLDEDDEE